MALRAHQKGLELIVDVAAVVPPWLRGDPGRLRQILVNLLGNAIKFTPQGEVVLRVTAGRRDRPTTSCCTSRSATPASASRSTSRSSIFEAFHAGRRVDDADLRRHRAGPDHLVAAGAADGRASLGGERAGQGSTFHFTARFAPVAAPAAAAAARRRSICTACAVLVVDDNATNRRLLDEMLFGWRMVPTLAASVPEALVALRAAQKTGTAVRAGADRRPDARGGRLRRWPRRSERTRRSPARPSSCSPPAASPGTRARCRELGIAALPRQADQAVRAARRDRRWRLSHRPLDGDGRRCVTRHSCAKPPLAARILLVEDNKVNQLVARRLLENRGHTVVVADNGTRGARHAGRPGLRPRSAAC